MMKVAAGRSRPRALRAFCRSSAVAFLFTVALLTQAVRASADDIVVMTSGAFTAAYLELSEPFSRTTGHRFITATTTMGVGRESRGSVGHGVRCRHRRSFDAARGCTRVPRVPGDTGCAGGHCEDGAGVARRSIAYGKYRLRSFSGRS